MSRCRSCHRMGIKRARAVIREEFQPSGEQGPGGGRGVRVWGRGGEGLGQGSIELGPRSGARVGARIRAGANNEAEARG